MQGHQILDQIEAELRRFTIQQSREAYAAITLYAAYTHASEYFQFAPRLIYTSAEKRSGKTRTLEVTQALCRDPLVAANATVPAIFRSLGKADRPRTLVFDEVDTVFGTKMKSEQNEDLRALLNAGFQDGMPVLRTVGPNHEPTEFPTFAPAILAGIGTLPDTIVDRAVNIRLRRRKSTEEVEAFRIRRDTPRLHHLRDQVQQWIAEEGQGLADAEPPTPLSDRAADLWEPLLAVADLAGGNWPIKARAAAVKLSADAAAEDQHHSEGMELLADIRDVLAFRRGTYIASKDLLAALKGVEDSPWRDMDLSGARLARLLRPYQVSAGKLGDGRARGYKVAAFEDAFSRYLPDMRQEASEVSESA